MQQVPSDMEYNSLRQEILEVLNRELTLINFGVTATAAILVFAFNTSESFIFLLPLAVLYGTLAQISNCLRQIITVSTYLRVCVEQDRSDLNWETFVYRLRKNLHGQKQFNPLTRFTELNYSIATTEFNYAISIVILGMICSILAVAYADHRQESLVAILFMAAWLFIAAKTLLQLRYANVGVYENKLERKFQELLAENNSERLLSTESVNYPSDLP